MRSSSHVDVVMMDVTSTPIVCSRGSAVKCLGSADVRLCLKLLRGGTVAGGGIKHVSSAMLLKAVVAVDVVVVGGVHVLLMVSCKGSAKLSFVTGAPLAKVAIRSGACNGLWLHTP